MILVIRGHIRDSFTNEHLYNLVKLICEKLSGIKIYIHTWTIFNNGITWRETTPNTRKVTEEIIKAYFKDLSSHIKKIMIDDDSSVPYEGSVYGRICRSLMPRKGWKNYIYGKYRIFSYLNEREDKDETVINFRFDIMKNFLKCCEISFDNVIDFINDNKNNEFRSVKFIFENTAMGIDNLYIGSVHMSYKLLDILHYRLDYLMSLYPDVENQEYLVWHANNILFTEYKGIDKIDHAFSTGKMALWHLTNSKK